MTKQYILKLGENMTKYYKENKTSMFKELIDIFKSKPSENGIQDLVYCGLSPEESIFDLNIYHYCHESMKERHITVHYPADARIIKVNLYSYRVISVTPEELVLEYIKEEKNKK